MELLGGSSASVSAPTVSRRSETQPLVPRFRRYNAAAGRGRRDAKRLTLAILSVAALVAVFLGLFFGITSSNSSPTSLHSESNADQPSPLELLVKRQWPIKAENEVNSRTDLLSAAQPLSVTAAYLQAVRASSLGQLGQLDRLERRLQLLGMQLPAGSASFRHQQLVGGAGRRARDGIVNGWAGRRIKTDHNLTGPWFRHVRQLTPVRPPPSCRMAPPVCDVTARYRTADGTCNNLLNPHWGSALTAFRRVVGPDYEDGVFQPRAASDGGHLPAGRQVSRVVFTDEYHADASVSLLMMQWGQFVDHDISATAAGKARDGSAIRCCGAAIDRDPSLLHPECMPLLVGTDDPVYAVHNVSCLDFVRSAPTPLCSYGPRQQLNQITSFIDGSNIYGSSDEQLSSLRSHTAGRLAVQTMSDGRELLPISADPDDGCNRNASMAADRYCFRSGDSRVNEQISLTVTHTQWVRQHNLVAAELAALNRHWDDERVFQESRRVTVAMMQHVTANEYLPLLLGPELASVAGLTPAASGYFTGYSDAVDPAVANVFATAAFRFGHSQIQGLLKMLGQFGKAKRFAQLHRFYFNPTPLYQPTQLDSLVRGQLTSCSRAVDGHLTSQITAHLFEADGAPVGLDLGAINVQRGRDHGLPAYNVWRRACGLPPAASFAQLRQLVRQPSQVDQLQAVYRSVEHVDLYVGGLLEAPIDGAVVGPTFACLLTDQFVRLKTGDRFWYETADPQLRFTAEQLQQLRKTNLARVLCDTSDNVREVQPRPLLLPSSDNLPQPCGSVALPIVDLSYWEESAP